MQAASSDKRLTWLHLSDLHLCEPRTGWDEWKVLGKLTEDFERLQKKYALRPDLIFFTGDLAFGGIGKGKGETLEEQFAAGAKFLEGVCSAFSPAVPKDRVFIVPGNHDVNRAKVQDDQTYWLDNQKELDTVRDKMRSASLQWKRYMERLAEYRAFLETNGYQHLLTEPDWLIYAQQLEINGMKVGIAGFNSAWSCGRDGELGRLWFCGDWQVGKLRPKIDGSDVTLALVHHPGNWFGEAENPSAMRELESHFHFVLHGHEHQTWLARRADGGTTVAAAACYDRSNHENGYNFVSLDLNRVTGKVWLRRYDAIGKGWTARALGGDLTDERGQAKLDHLRLGGEAAAKKKSKA